MDRDAFLKLFHENIMEPDEALPSGDSPIQEIPRWDSLLLLTTIAFLESDYGVLVSGKEIGECSTMNDLMTLVESKLS